MSYFEATIIDHMVLRGIVITYKLKFCQQKISLTPYQIAELLLYKTWSILALSTIFKKQKSLSYQISLNNSNPTVPQYANLSRKTPCEPVGIHKSSTKK